MATPTGEALLIPPPMARHLSDSSLLRRPAIRETPATCPRESRRGVEYESRLVEQAPVDREATLALARAACRLLVKSGDGDLRLDAPLTDADIVHYLVHEDGFLRV